MVWSAASSDTFVFVLTGSSVNGYDNFVFVVTYGTNCPGISVNCIVFGFGFIVAVEVWK